MVFLFFIKQGGYFIPEACFFGWYFRCWHFLLFNGLCHHDKLNARYVLILAGYKGDWLEVLSCKLIHCRIDLIIDFGVDILCFIRKSLGSTLYIVGAGFQILGSLRQQ